MYQIQISRTSKRAGRNSGDYTCYDRFEETVKTKKDINKYLSEELYINLKNKEKMYIDSRGNAKQIGWIFKGKTKEYNNQTGKYETYYLEDWVSIYKLSRVFL